MDFEVEGVRPRGRAMKTWSEVTEKGCQTRQIWIKGPLNGFLLLFTAQYTKKHSKLVALYHKISGRPVLDHTV